MDTSIITRLAPTPSGYLHVGNAYNFLLNWLAARAVGGKVLLRIDDLDSARVRDEYLDDVFYTLDWLGLDWDLGPQNVPDFKQNWSQTKRIPAYQNMLKRLAEKNLLFACECSRKMLEGHSVYPRRCNHKQLPLHTADVAWRLAIEELDITTFEDLRLGHVAFETGLQAGCAVMRRRDGVPAYHIASLTDDLAFGVNFIARGMDLLPSTALQLHLAHYLGAESFLKTRFLHHALITDTDGRKISKSAGDTSLKYLRENGMKASELIRAFAHWQGIKMQQEIQTAHGLVDLWNEPRLW